MVALGGSPRDASRAFVQDRSALHPDEPAVLRRRDGRYSAESLAFPRGLGDFLTLAGQDAYLDYLSQWQKLACLPSLLPAFVQEAPWPDSMPEKAVSAAKPLDAAKLPVSLAEGQPQLDPHQVSHRFTRFGQQLSSLMGRPLVSPCVNIPGLSAAWLLVEPCHGELRSKSQKERFRKRTVEGPLRCRLRVKVAEPEKLGRMRCSVLLAGEEVASFEHNFESPLAWTSDELNWLDFLGGDKAIEVALILSACEGAPL